MLQEIIVILSLNYGYIKRILKDINRYESGENEDKLDVYLVDYKKII